MRRDEVPPGGIVAALWGGRDAVTLQNIANRLIGDLMAETGERPGYEVIAQARILVCNAHDQLFQLRAQFWPTGIGTPLRTVELLRNDAPIPGQDCIGLGNAGDFGQALAPKPFADFGQVSSFAGPTGGIVWEAVRGGSDSRRPGIRTTTAVVGSPFR
jgi:hypothetical protein